MQGGKEGAGARLARPGRAGSGPARARARARDANARRFPAEARPGRLESRFVDNIVYLEFDNNIEFKGFEFRIFNHARGGAAGPLGGPRRHGAIDPWRAEEGGAPAGSAARLRPDLRPGAKGCARFPPAGTVFAGLCGAGYSRRLPLLAVFAGFLGWLAWQGCMQASLKMAGLQR